MVGRGVAGSMVGQGVEVAIAGLWKEEQGPDTEAARSRTQYFLEPGIPTFYRSDDI